MDLKLQPEIKLRKCAAAGCTDLPTDTLPQNMQVPDLIWCKDHANQVARMISEQDYKDFIAALRRQGIKQEPRLTNGQENPTTERRCCVPTCKKKDKVISGIGFTPYKQPGIAWVCDSHFEAVNYVTHRLNGQRLIHDLARKSRGKRPDPVAEKRNRAILASYEKHHDERNYIEAVCRDLQKERVRLPVHWVSTWNGSYSLGLQGWEWLAAYEHGSKRKLAELRRTIQRHISRTCRLRLRSG